MKKQAKKQGAQKTKQFQQEETIVTTLKKNLIQKKSPENLQPFFNPQKMTKKTNLVKKKKGSKKLMANSSYDKINHVDSIFLHLRDVGKEVSIIFKKEYKDGQLFGASPASKITNFRASILWLETLLVSYIDKDYKQNKDRIMEEYKELWNKKDLDGCFEKINELAQRLMIIAESNDFLTKQSVSAEWKKQGEEDE